MAPETATLHPTRAAILHAVQAAPGHGFRELGRQLRLPPGTLHHHLAVLARCRLVRLESVGSRLVILPADERRSPELVVLLREPTLAALRDFVASRGRVHQRQIHAEFPAPRSTLGNRLKRLTDAAALRAQRQGRFVFYEAIHA